MADRWSRELNEASYGGLKLLIFGTEDSAGSAIAVHDSPHVDGANLEPMGKNRRITRTTVIFFARNIGDDYLARFMEFYELAHDQEAHTFVHPLTGSYEAFVPNFDYRADPNMRNAMIVTVTFAESTVDIAEIEEPGAGSLAGAVIAALDVQTAALDTELADAGISTTITTDIAAKTDLWSTADPRDVRLELAELSRRIDAEIEDLDLAGDLDKYNVFKGLMMVHGSLRNAALSFIQASDQVIERTVTVAVPLLVLAAEIYGARDSFGHLDELRSLNDIDNEARIPEGAIIRAIAPSG